MRKMGLLVAGALVLGGCSSDHDPGLIAPASDASVPTSSPSAAKAPGTTTTEVIGEIPEGPLLPGSYALTPIGPRDELWAVVDVPTGYHSWASFIEADEPREVEDPLMLGLWRVTGVYEDPCAASHLLRPTSVRATAKAFLRQRLTSSTRPREIEVAGHHGLFMEVTTPTDFEYATCDDAEMNLWDGRPDSSYWTRMPGMVNKLWILDIDGEPMLIQRSGPSGRQRAARHTP